MTRDNKVTFYLDEDEAEQLEEAADAVSLSKSTFSRTNIMREARNVLLETDSKEYFAYGGQQNGQNLLGDTFWESFHKKRISKKIKAKLIFYESLKWWAKELNKYPLTEVRISKSDFEEVADTAICGNRVLITIFLENPFAFLIEDESTAIHYKKLFELLWKNAGK